MGDANGVVIVPRDASADVLDRLRTRASVEAAYEAAVARGDFSNDWVDAILGDAGVG